ncbi:hypothetical protein A3J13_00750 [Candidatus Daviesbacteria bacterium RIFCSPLOWO2_02_FULL_36_8]|uniref:Peptidase M10 metallopeptidase domain-containing protein n=1 Tax=Candidatus Daviesbacteria bacterium RIFCSPLOWO2_02_FULL_36_8 TaxID=1797793 RepID=A0A1F5MGR1_9BACT|nr:MAG: hypothetical protein A3J13_00750 [Candidatus Daviesbacteria bacterium RIFCSPLOWO2_02_FULL_36_8]
MKKIYLFIIFLIILLIALKIPNSLQVPALTNLFYFSVCDQPIRYRIDEIDPQFKLSKNNFTSYVNDAAQIWNNALNKNLFAYDPEGSLSINLIYDERQSLTEQVTKLEETVKSDQQNLKPEINQYQSLSAEFNRKVDELNKEIDDWNQKGGAPEEEYNKLIQKQKDLKKQADSLNKMSQDLNNSTDKYNTQVNQLNQSISTLNYALEEKPEEGVFKYPENRIEIYLNINSQELIHTLAHELGHSIGLNHIDNRKAIMYSKTNSSIKLSEDDISALENICKEKSIFELAKHYFNLFLIQYKNKLENLN